MEHTQRYIKNKHLIGTMINNWEILDVVDSKEHYHTRVLARCGCGTTKEVQLTKIKTGRIVDCGCGHSDRLKNASMNKYIDLVGSRVNGWTVLDIIPPKNGQHNTFVLCRCKCGHEKAINVHNLLNGRSKDCGCGRKQTLKDSRTNNLVGKRFGRLLVSEMLDDRNKNGRIMYRCLCDCGNEIEVIGNSLTTNHTLSCGCLISYWNSYIGSFLQSRGVLYKQEYTVNIDNSLYRFDFFLPEYNAMIEYDGIQHFETVRYYGKNENKNYDLFLRTQKSDQIKDSYCANNGISILRIPYWETKNINNIINNHLQRLNEKGSVA